MAATSRGIDVSNNNGAQNWSSRVAGGLTFAFVKASEGEHTSDAEYRSHMSGLLKSGALPGAYHYAWSNQSAATEAAHYVSVVKGDAAGRAFVHALDLERNKEGTNYAGMTASGIRAYAEAWIDHVKAAFPGQKVIVYTSGDDIAKGRMPRNADGLWYPAYPAGPLTYAQAEQRARPAPSGKTPLFWQFSSDPIDQSIAYMTPAALRAWAGEETTDMPLTDAEKDDVATRAARKVWGYLLDSPTAAKGTDASRPAGTFLAYGDAHYASVITRLDTQAATIKALAALAGSGVDTDQVVAAVEQAIANAVVKVDVDVTGAQPTAPTAG